MKRKDVRFNEEEWARHEWLKDFFGLRDLHGEDGQTVKEAETVAFNVVRNIFGDSLRDIFKKHSRDELIKIRALQHERIKKSRTLGGARP